MNAAEQRWFRDAGTRRASTALSAGVLLTILSVFLPWAREYSLDCNSNPCNPRLPLIGTGSNAVSSPPGLTGLLVLILVLVGLIAWLVIPPRTRSVGPWMAVIVVAAVTAAAGTIWYVTLPNLSDDIVTIRQLPAGFLGLLAGLALIILGAVLRLRSLATATPELGQPATSAAM